jgi:hypothetical protein
MKNILSFLLLSFVTFISFGQRNFILADLKTPYTYRVNASVMPESKVFVGIPFLGSINFQATNRISPINHMFVRNSLGTYDLNVSNSYFDSLGTKSYVGLEWTNQLLAFGFKVKKNYFTLDISNRFISQVGFGKDFLIFALEGNGGSLFGKRADFSGLGGNLTDFVEYGLGYSREWDEKLNVGARFKLLSGLGNIKGYNSLGLTTDPSTSDLTFDGTSDVNSSNSLIFTDSAYAANNDPGQIISNLFNFSNIGFGLDFGGSYKYSDKISLNASVVDLGFIKWTDRVANYKVDKFSYVFKGVDLNELLSDSSNVGKEITDSLSKIFKVGQTATAYTTGLPTKIYLGGSYKWNNYLSSGVTFYQEFFNSSYRPGLVLSSTFSYKHWLGATLNYGIYAGSAANVGLGIRFRGFYILTDNILSAINYQAITAASFALGFNITVGKTHEEKASAKTN